MNPPRSTRFRLNLFAPLLLSHGFMYYVTPPQLTSYSKLNYCNHFVRTRQNNRLNGQIIRLQINFVSISFIGIVEGVLSVIIIIAVIQTPFHLKLINL